MRFDTERSFSDRPAILVIGCMHTCGKFLRSPFVFCPIASPVRGLLLPFVLRNHVAPRHAAWVVHPAKETSQSQVLIRRSFLTTSFPCISLPGFRRGTTLVLEQNELRRKQTHQYLLSLDSSPDTATGELIFISTRVGTTKHSPPFTRNFRAALTCLCRHCMNPLNRRMNNKGSHCHWLTLP